VGEGKADRLGVGVGAADGRTGEVEVGIGAGEDTAASLGSPPIAEGLGALAPVHAARIVIAARSHARRAIGPPPSVVVPPFDRRAQGGVTRPTAEPTGRRTRRSV
jgi:hypothetical protein